MRTRQHAVWFFICFFYLTGCSDIFTNHILLKKTTLTSNFCNRWISFLVCAPWHAHMCVRDRTNIQTYRCFPKPNSSSFAWYYPHSHKVAAIWFAVLFNKIHLYKSQIILEKCFGKNYFLIQEFKMLLGLYTLFKFTFDLLQKKF